MHSHTWYANFAGHLAKLLYGIPHVATVHSLEPMRPWKEEQLGGGYALSSFCERTALEAADAIIAVSREQARDVLACYPAIDPARVTVIYNGIDTRASTGPIHRHGRPGAARHRPGAPVGRVRRPYHAPEGRRPTSSTPRCSSTPAAQFVLCAGAPDTPEIAAEIEAKVARVRSERGSVIWIDQMLPRADVVQILSHATVFVCPSIYEPLGIVNLEAMACETAVVATRTGGIPEVVEDGETGLLVPFEPRGRRLARPSRSVALRDGYRRARKRARLRPRTRPANGQGRSAASNPPLRLAGNRGANARPLQASRRLRLANIQGLARTARV